MYRWSWDNAQFDFGSAQAREVLQLGLTFGGEPQRSGWFGAWFLRFQGVHRKRSINWGHPPGAVVHLCGRKLDPLRIHLWAGPLVNSEAEVVVGDRAITVRPHACSRGACLEKLLNNELGGLHQAAVGAWICPMNHNSSGTC